MSTLTPCWSGDFAVQPAWGDVFARMNPAGSTPESVAAAERAHFDAELMRRMGRSDREAFAQLYDRFSRPLFATALRILHNSAEAEDIVQDVFLALWEKAAAFESGRGSAFAWAVTLTRNRAIDRVRMRKRRSELLAETTAEDAGTQPSGTGPDSADGLMLKEQAGAVRAAVAARLSVAGWTTHKVLSAATSETAFTANGRTPARSRGTGDTGSGSERRETSRSGPGRSCRRRPFRRAPRCA